jgi:hypothetical protein
VRKHLPQKTETKAILRAVTLALQLKRGGYTAQDLQKPFLIIGVSSTPVDPEVRRLRVLQASGELTGRGLPAPTDESAPSSASSPSAELSGGTPVAPEAAQTGATGVPQSREPDPNEPAATSFGISPAAAGEVMFGEGFRAKGKRVREVRSEYLQHIAFEHQFSPEQELVVLACRTWVQWLNGQQVQA